MMIVSTGLNVVQVAPQAGSYSVLRQLPLRIAAPWSPNPGDPASKLKNDSCALNPSRSRTHMILDHERHSSQCALNPFRI